MNSNFNNCPKFGEVFFASLCREDHVQGGIRPVVIAQNDVGNMHSPTIGIIPMSSKTDKAKHLPVHVVVPTEQMRTIPATQLIGRIGALKHKDLVNIRKALDIQFPFPAA